MLSYEEWLKARERTHPQRNKNVDGVLGELHALQVQVSNVYRELTGGRCESPWTGAQVLKSYVDDQVNRRVQEALQHIVSSDGAEQAAEQELELVALGSLLGGKEGEDVPRQ